MCGSALKHTVQYRSKSKKSVFPEKRSARFRFSVKIDASLLIRQPVDTSRPSRVPVPRAQAGARRAAAGVDKEMRDMEFGGEAAWDGALSQHEAIMKSFAVPDKVFCNLLDQCMRPRLPDLGWR
jgi:hypothetical protein